MTTKYDQAVIDKLYEQINDDIDDWHSNPDTLLPLWAYLGMTPEQYEHFVRNPEGYIVGLLDEKPRSAAEIRECLGWAKPSEEQQIANLNYNLSEIEKDHD